MTKFSALALALCAPTWAFASSCVPVATWSGKLIAPTAENRSADGGIRFLVENAPIEYAHLRNTIVHLNYGVAGSEARANFDRRKRDVSFGPKAIAANEKEGILLARGLDGMKAVSPLESLAASRPNDVVRAELLEVAVSQGEEGTVLTTSADPQLIDGDEQCLVQVVSVLGSSAIVQHYDPATKSFTGETEEVALDFKPHLPQGDEYEPLTFQGITTQRNNQTGWNMYGSRKSGKFVVEALESYAFYKVHGTDGDERKIQTYKGFKDYWNIGAKDKTHTRQLIYKSKAGGTSEEFQLGQRFLVVHAFGAFNEHGMTLGKYRGHASLGLATIVAHPITGEPVYQIVYKQTYGHSGSGVFPGSFRSFAYTANLYRGLLWLRPAVDVLYPIDDLGDDFVASFTQTFDELNSVYRVGFGHGWARITSITSCVHDTGNTLIGFLAGQLSAKKPVGPRRELLRRMARNLGQAVLPPARFRNAELLEKDVDFKLSTLIKVRKNLTISLPRNFQDALLKSFADDGQHPVVALQSVMPGDEQPHATPHAPDRITSFIGALVSEILP